MVYGMFCWQLVGFPLLRGCDETLSALLSVSVTTRINMVEFLDLSPSLYVVRGTCMEAAHVIHLPLGLL